MVTYRNIKWFCNFLYAGGRGGGGATRMLAEEERSGSRSDVRMNQLMRGEAPGQPPDVGHSEEVRKGKAKSIAS